MTAGTASAFSWNAKSGYRQDGVAPTGLSSAYAFQKVGDRYYDPALMCFLTRDTELGELPYTYCNGDPVNCTDPSGHSALGYFTAFLFVALAVGTIVVFAPVAGPVFIGSAIGVVLLAGVASLGGLYRDTLADGIEKANKDRDDLEKAGRQAERNLHPAVPGGHTAPIITYQDYAPVGGGVYAPTGAPYTGSPHNNSPFPSGSVDQSGQPLQSLQ